jgi:hypothetical protein
MLAQSRVQVARYAAVMRVLVSFANKDVNVVESVDQTNDQRKGWPAKP